jgi:aspartate aminotransferase-like enzyme
MAIKAGNKAESPENPLMPENFADLKLFITGPTHLRREVREAGALPEFGHRDAENDRRFAPVREHLRAVAGVGDDYEVLLFNGSGTTGMEASLRSLAADGETVLNVSVGAFGDLYHKLALANGKKARLLKFEPGEAVDAGRLKQEIHKLRPAVVTLTHNETSTGVENDVAAACAIVREAGALALVDGVSIFGGAPSRIAEARPAMYVTATQKALGLPAGFAAAFVSAEAFDKAERVENRGYASDILAQRERAAKNQTLTTPNTTLANQMYVQLKYIVEQEGVEARFERHRVLRGIVHDYVAALPGCELFAPQGHRSPTLTCVRVPEGVSFEDLKLLKERMRARGYLFDPGYGKLNRELEAAGRPPVFRIGHMGDMDRDMLEGFLEEMAEEFPK